MTEINLDLLKIQVCIFRLDLKMHLGLLLLPAEWDWSDHQLIDGFKKEHSEMQEWLKENTTGNYEYIMEFGEPYHPFDLVKRWTPEIKKYMIDHNDDIRYIPKVLYIKFENMDDALMFKLSRIRNPASLGEE